MTIITSYDFASDTWTHHTDESAQRQAWRDAVAEIADKARLTLPDCASRVNAAVKIVLAGDVEVLDNHTGRVASQSNGTTKYHIVNGGCTCPDYSRAPSNWCKHRIAFGIQVRSTTLAKRKLAEQNGTAAEHAETDVKNSDHGVDAPTPPEVDTRYTQGIPEVLKPYLVHLHGKPFVRYAGLLALAHEHGLVNLSARIEFHDDNLVLASATATFQDGKAFTEWADAMPSNVGSMVRPHWIRMALTRAKARALRDALQIGIAALEELADTE